MRDVIVGLALLGEIAVAATFIGAGTIGYTGEAYALPVCQYEDGNPDGSACVWTDPGTGTAYFVKSENYR